MSPMRRISARAPGSALTLRRSISRSTWSSSLRSVTLMTSMSLCSCLITCSMMNASPRTTSVIRDTVGSRVSPTERLSMLYPRAEKSPATRESTPNLFSTSTAMVCLRCSTVLTLEPRLRLGRAVAHLAAGRGQDHVGVGAARRHHGEHALVLVHPHVDHHRSGGGDHLLEGRTHLGRLGGADPGAAVCLGELHEVGAGSEVDGAEALLVDDALPLAHHAVAAVVDDDRLHGKLALVAGRELLAVHLEGAVAVDVHH